MYGAVTTVLLLSSPGINDSTGHQIAREIITVQHQSGQVTRKSGIISSDQARHAVYRK